MMNNSINLSKNAVVFLRKIISLASVLLSTVILYIWLAGAIPFANRTADIVYTINLIFEVFEFGRKPFIDVVCSVGFSIIYIVFAFKTILSLINELKNIKIWFSSKLDSSITRTRSKFCLVLFNSTVWKFFALLIISSLISNFQIKKTTLLIVIGVFLICLLVNITFYTYITQNVTESVIVSISQQLLMIGAFLFCFAVSTVELGTVWKSFGSFFSLFKISGLSGKTIFYAFVQTILIPIFYIWNTVSILIMSYESLVDKFAIIEKTKKLLKRNVIAVIVIIILTAYINEYRDVTYYISTLFDNVQLLLIPALLYMASNSAKRSVPETDCFDPEPATTNN